MKILQMKIENFMALGSADIKLADRGLVLVQGVNSDDTSASSNGAGKSSMADALCWSFFGVTARGESGDAVINQKAGKGCAVSIVLQEGDDFYNISRYRKHKTGKNSVSLVKFWPTVKEPIDLGKGTERLTQIEIEKVLGCSYEVFRASIYSGQDDMPDLPGMTDRNLKQIVEEAAGVTVLERAYEEARSRSNAAKLITATARTKRDTAMERIADAEETIKQAEVSRDDWENKRGDRAHNANVRTGEFRKHLVAANERLKAYRPVADIKQEILHAHTALGAVAEEQKTERQIAGDLARAEARKGALKGKLDTLKLAFDKTKAGLDAIGHKIGCPCDSCGRPLTEAEIEPTKKGIVERAAAIKTDYDATRSQAIDAISAIKTLAETLESHRASMTDTSAMTATLATLQSELSTVESAKREVTKCEAAVSDSESLETAIAAEANPFIAQIEMLTTSLGLRHEEFEGSERGLISALSHQTIIDHAAKVFSPAGARGAILEEVTPHLNDQTAKYLGVLSDGNISATWSTLSTTAKGEVREKFAIEVEHAKGGRSFGLLSGGEKRKVRIAAALALQDLVATRATKKLELWIGDEIDNALDVAGIERLMAILEEKARERGSVFIVSHSDLKDWVSQTMTVTKEGGVSRIEEGTA